MNKLQNIGIGVLFMILGTLVIWYTSKRPASKLTSIKANGYMCGIGFILFGIMYILNKLRLW